VVDIVRGRYTPERSTSGSRRSIAGFAAIRVRRTKVGVPSVIRKREVSLFVLQVRHSQT